MISTYNTPFAACATTEYGIQPAEAPGRISKVALVRRRLLVQAIREGCRPQPSDDSPPSGPVQKQASTKKNPSLTTGVLPLRVT